MSISASAQQCAFPEPRNIKTDELQWKDGGTSLITRLTLDGKPFELLFRFDKDGRLMVASLSSLNSYSEGRFAKEYIELASKYGSGSSPYSVFTELEKENGDWTKEYYDFKGGLVMIAKIPFAGTDSEATHFSPSGKKLSKNDIRSAWDRLQHPASAWIRSTNMK